jgi:hypothetical protein
MTVSLCRRLPLLLLLLVALGAPRADARAEDEAPGPEDGADDGLDQPDADEEVPEDPRAAVPTLRELTDAEARPLADALNKAARRKETPDIQPALDAIADVRHESFLKPLVKLLGSDNGRMAQLAGDLLEHRATEDVAKDLWRKGWDHKENRRRYAVRTTVLRAYARLGLDLDKRQFEDVEREWKWMLGNPHESYGPALADICWYFGMRKDKRHALAMAQELDAPESTNHNSPTAPPAEWWERRWKQWKVMIPLAIQALERITGQRFAKREEAQAWFEANKDSFGIAWRDW